MQHLFRLMLLGGMSLLLLSACGGGDSSTPVLSQVSGSTGYDIFHVDTPESDNADYSFTYQLDLGATTRDVYFIVTNISLTDTAESPLVADLYALDPMLQAQQKSEQLSAWAIDNGIGLPDRPDVSLFNSDPERYGNLTMELTPSSFSIMGIPAAPLLDTVGDTQSFSLDTSGSSTVNATCRKVVSAHDRTLNIWVADDSWGTGCGKANCLDPAQVDVMATNFLQAGNDNDIYEWLTNIYGAEWGGASFSNLIGVDKNITILLYDIDADNSTSGGVLGFFWSKDNFVSSGTNGIAGSNQRVMFYLDSVLFATPEGGSWEVSDRWPNKLIGTLAHEFQHMINYYQKSVLLGTNPDTWLNEMSSLLAEDIVETKAAISGPRGVTYLDGSAGNSGNTTGRLPRFVRFDYLPIAEWFGGSISDPGDTNVLNSYALNYSYGAFLARNFGGPALLRAMVHNNQAGTGAISAALTSAGYAGEDFASTLRKWGVAVLLSDDDSNAVPTGYRYNSGGFQSFAYSASTYNLGSINMYNYTHAGQIGPRIYDSLPPADSMAGLYKTSNLYYRVGTGLTGQLSRNLTLRKGQKLTVLTR